VPENDRGYIPKKEEGKQIFIERNSLNYFVERALRQSKTFFFHKFRIASVYEKRRDAAEKREGTKTALHVIALLFTF